MKCPDCGHDAPPHSVYCPRCGRRFDADPASASSASTGTSAVAGPSPVEALDAKQRLAAAATGAYTEEDLWEGTYSPKAMIGTWFVAIVITIGLLAIGLAFGQRPGVWVAAAAAIVLVILSVAAITLVRRWSIRYKLTTQRFIQQRGLLRRTTDRIQTIDIDDITVEQGVFDRFVGTGMIKVVSSDRTDPTLLMPGIENVTYVADLMDNARRAERRRRGLRIESIQADGGDMHGGHG
ncbi:MAG: PH domain-containing protein [Planctomycetia bacterium]|nr:PH domain-containing protein [Planctomycetia bacterium]